MVDQAARSIMRGALAARGYPLAASEIPQPALPRIATAGCATAKSPWMMRSSVPPDGVRASVKVTVLSKPADPLASPAAGL